MSVFDNPLLLGFEHFERTLERVSKLPSDGYPPYNIEQLTDGRLRITLAVAGFSEEELSVQIVDGQLVLRGKQSPDDRERIFLHRGIAGRQFQRTFVLADGIEVTGAVLDRGLLHIDLMRPVNEPDVRAIPIRRADPAAKGAKPGRGARSGPVTIDAEEA